MRRALELAEALADALLERASVPARAPVDVHEIARILGLDVIRVTLQEDGYLAADDRGAHIFVNADQAVVRQRFSVAHELGHWALHFDGVSPSTVLTAQRAFRSEEMLCNTVAGALLLPRAWMRQAHPELWAVERESLEDVRTLASDAHVSLEVALVRLRDVCGWTATMLHWRRRAQRRPGRPPWRLLAEAGVFPWERGSVLPVPATNDLLTQAASAGRDIHVGWPVPLSVASRECDVECDVWVRGDDAVTLVPRRRRGVAPPSGVA
jgi:Zn-dependent peptidase ImmA (M78 family)